jgi:hypothetical protein
VSGQELLARVLASRAFQRRVRFELNRTERRRQTQHPKAVHTPGTTVEDILARGPVVRHSGPTGNPPWWAEMKREAVARRHLSKQPLVALDAVNQRVAHSLSQMGVESVYELATADYELLRMSRGVGPGTLQKIRAELVSRRVPVKWEVPA